MLLKFEGRCGGSVSSQVLALLKCFLVLRIGAEHIHLR